MHPLKAERNWYAILVVMGGVFLSTMDSGMINVAIPTIMRYFKLPIEAAEQVVTVYLLTITISLVFWGRIADRLGLEKVYLTGLFIFSLGAVSCYMSQSYFVLLVARCIQGLGASMMMSSGPAIIKSSVAEGELGRNLGLVGVATASGLLTGPFVCGQLLSHFSWRSIYMLMALLSCGIGCGAFVLFKRKLREKRKQFATRFDWKGGLCWVGIVLLLINLLQKAHLVSPMVSVVKAIALFLLIIFFIRVERKAGYPILPLDIFSKRYYWVGIVTAAISFASLFSVLVMIPFYLEYVQKLTSREIGMIMMAVPATLILCSPSAGFLYDKIGAKFLTSSGLFVSCFALFGLSQLSVDSSTLQLILLLATVGAGQSIFLSPNSASVLSRVEDNRVGATAGILATARNFGMVVGATLATVLFSHFSSGADIDLSHMSIQMVSNDTFIEALSMTLKCVAGLSLTACFVSLLRD
ncbi:MFS transporter [Desulforhopalus sp. 52FAK]